MKKTINERFEEIKVLLEILPTNKNEDYTLTYNRIKDMEGISEEKKVIEYKLKYINKVKDYLTKNKL